VSPRKQRIAIALEAVGHGLAEIAQPGETALHRHLRQALHHLVRGQLAVAADPEDARQHVAAGVLQARRRREHQRVAEGRGEPRLIAVGERVATDVDQDDQVGAHRVGGLADPRGKPGRARVRIDQQHPLAQEARHVGFGEHDVAGMRLGRRRHDAAGQRLGVLDLLDAAGTGARIDHAPLPGHAAEHRLGALVEAAGLGGRERAHHVAASAHSDHERPTCAGHQCLRIRHAGDCARGARWIDSS
jgi:hypothetical protein